MAYMEYSQEIRIESLFARRSMSDKREGGRERERESERERGREGEGGREGGSFQYPLTKCSGFNRVKGGFRPLFPTQPFCSHRYNPLFQIIMISNASSRMVLCFFAKQ